MAALQLTHAPEPAALRAEVAALAGRLGTDLHRRHLEVAADLGVDAEVRAWLVRDGREVVGAVLRRSDDGPLLVALDPARSAFGLAAGLVAGGFPPGELIAQSSLARALAQGWATMVGAEAVRQMGLHLLACTELAADPELPAPDGRPRSATPADAEAVRAMVAAFVREALPHRTAFAERAADRAVARLGQDEGLCVWDVDDVPVAITRIGDLVAGARPIMSVYTPPEYRGQGYATALVAALTRDALASDTAVVNLAADVDHAFSTALYERIGYRRVGEQASWRVARPDA
jgi:RimJ/RimL family protein N-acetyltransferase